MEIKITLKLNLLRALQEKANSLNWGRVILVSAVLVSIVATTFVYMRGEIVAYGDAESHLNIAKRVVHSITPGFAQLGGIWLPLPHVLMLPFVAFDFLWRSGLAGSIVSGAAYVLSAYFIYRTLSILTHNRFASVVGSFVFMLNPNVLYLQATPMTELVLVAFFVMSGYYFIKFIESESMLDLVFAGFFGLCATISRYDGWFLIAAEAVILVLLFPPFSKMSASVGELRKNWNPESWRKLEGMLIAFCTIAGFGIVLWLVWDWLILGDPLYFTHSQFSAKSQQQGWLARGQLPAYQNIWLSFLYYFVTAMSNVGVVMTLLTVVGLLHYIFSAPSVKKTAVAGLLSSVFFFYVITLFMGQSVIFIPHVTPPTFDWTLFNVRYGVLMVPFAAVFIGYLWHISSFTARLTIISLFFVQAGMFGVGYSKIISYEDGVSGLSHSKRPDAELFMDKEYDYGLVLLDDFARTMSIIRSGVPMENIIYVGNKPYWEESFTAPEKYARWIILQKDDQVWARIYDKPEMQARLFKYFEKAYTSPEILIFKRNNVSAI